MLLSIRTSLVLFLFLLAAHTSYAQVDSVFWFVAPEVSQQHEDRPVRFRFSTLDKPATITLSKPADPDFPVRTFQLAANQTQTFSITNPNASNTNLENSPAGQVNTKGVFISSTAPITAYYEVGQQFNVDLFVLKGRNALGQDFVIPGQNFWPNGLGGTSGFDLVATENNTVIEVVPTVNVTGTNAGTTLRLVLQKGQTYSVRETGSTATNTLAGSTVKATKPIAITLYDDSINVPDEGCYDIAGDQIVPIGIVGNEYIVRRGSLNSTSNERVFVTAIEDNTQVFVNGGSSPTFTLNAYQTGSVSISGVNEIRYLTSDKNFYLMQYTGIGCELSGALIPSINCRGTQQISFTRSTSEPFFMNLLVQSGFENDFTLNGSTTLISGSSFEQVPGTNGKWLMAKFDFTSQVSVGAVRVANANTSFQLGILNGGGGTGTRYGYFSSFSSLFIGDDFVLCPGESRNIVPKGDTGANYTWSDGSTQDFLTVTQPGTYWVTMTNPFGCELSDTLQVFSATGTPLTLPQQLQGCQGTPLNFTAPAGFAGYVWSDGVVGQNRNFTQSGTYTLEGINPRGCSSFDQVTVNLQPLPEVDLGANRQICQGESVVLNAQVSGSNVTYQWSTGATTPSITVFQSGQYNVTVTRNGCSVQKGVQVTVNPPPALELGPDVTLCQGESVVLNGQVGGSANYQWSGPIVSAQSQITVSAPGVYTLTVSRGGCVVTDAVTVTVDQRPVVNLPATIRGCDQVVLDATVEGAATYLWSTGETTPSVTALASGTYQVTVERGACKVVAQSQVIVDASFSVALGEDQTICQGEAVVLNATTSGATAYLWNDGITTPQRTVSQAGTYSVTVTKGGCTASDSFVLKVNPLPVFSLGTDRKICEGSQIELSAQLSGEGISYLWNSGLTTPAITVGQAGQYIATVTKDGCSFSDTVQVTVVPLPKIEAGPDQTACAGTSVQLQAVVTGNADLVQWYSDVLLAPVQGTSITVTQAGTYYAKAVNDLEIGCQVIDSVEVKFDAAFTVALGNDLLLCNYESVTLDATVPNADSYQWLKNGQPFSTQPVITLNATNAGTFEVTVTRGTCVVSDVVGVQFEAPPALNLGPDQTLCQGETLTLSTGFSAYQHLWQNGSTATTLQVSQTGLYWVELTNGTCTIRDSINVVFDQAFDIELGEDLTVCASEPVLLSAIVPNADSYRWEKEGALVSENEAITVTAGSPVFGPGTYRLTVNRGVCTRTDEITVAFFPLPEPVAVLGTPSVCPGAVGILYEVAPQSGFTYHWQAVGGIITQGQGTARIAVDWPESKLDAEVRLVQENQFGCVNDTIIYAVEVFIQLKTETPNGLTQVCVNKATGNVYEIRPTVGSVYNWKLTGGEITDGQGSARVTVDWAGLGQHFLWLEEEVNTSVSTCFGTSDSLIVNVFRDSAAVTLRNVSLLPDQPGAVAVQWEATYEHRFANAELFVAHKPVAAPNFPEGNPALVANGQLTESNTLANEMPVQYRLSATNLCDEPVVSEVFQTIFLTGSKDESSQSIQLQWTAFLGWEVGRYEIWNKVDAETELSLEQTLLPSELAETLTNGLEGFTHEIRIKAIATDGQRQSWSNAVSVTFEHLIDLIPNVFTPNGDAYNQTFIIPKAHLYPANELVIVNRWGKVVYRKQGYANTWDGGDLVAGVYYYQFRTEQKNQTLKGTVHIMR